MLLSLQLHLCDTDVAIETLASSLQQLRNLALGIKTSNSREPRGQDVLILGRWLKAWPLPLLLDFKDTDSCDLRWRDKTHSIRLSRCWQALGLPSEASDWDNKRTLRFLRVQQQKVAAFASGLHQRLDMASAVMHLDEPTLVMIVNEDLGGWSLVHEWQHTT